MYGGGERGASCFTSGEQQQMLRLFGAAFPRCHRFRFHLGPEASRPRLFFFLFVCVCVCVVFFFFCLSVRTAKFLQPHKLGWGIESLRVVVSTMGDIEAPDSTQPRQSVLLAVLPSKEFATSRKGMLLIAEVVRHGSRSRDGRVSHSAHSALWPLSLSCLLDLRKRALRCYYRGFFF